MIRICSRKRPDRCPARASLAPATERFWHGLPPQIMSTGGSFAPSSLVISPTCCISGNRSLSYGNREGFYLTGPYRLNAIPSCRQRKPTDAIEQTYHCDFSFRLFSLVLFFSRLFTPFQKDFSLNPCFPPNWEKRGTFFCVFPLHLQKVHNLGVKKGRFLREILARIALNRRRAGSSPPCRKYISRFHTKKWAAKNPETVEVSGSFAWIFFDPQHGARRDSVRMTECDLPYHRRRGFAGFGHSSFSPGKSPLLRDPAIRL